jgi:hypothetical protein
VGETVDAQREPSLYSPPSLKLRHASRAPALHDICIQRQVRYPTTPDGRYFVVRGRLWRCANPSLDPATRERLVHELMAARSSKGRAMRASDSAAREQARQAVDRAKHALGERGDPWWTDGAPDYNRHMARNSPYREWFNSLDSAQIE